MIFATILFNTFVLLQNKLNFQKKFKINIFNIRTSVNMCRAYYSNCRGVSIPSHRLFIPCKEQVYIFDWKPCEKAQTGSVCEPTFYPHPAGDVGQCEECEKIERLQNLGKLVKKSSVYRVHCPRREPPSYPPPPYIAPPPYFRSSTSSVPRTPRFARISTSLQLPPITQFVESPHADGSPRRRYTTEVNCAPAQQQSSLSSPTLHSSASDESPNTRAAGTTSIIDPASLLRPPLMPLFLGSPCAGSQGIAMSTGREQQPIQSLPPAVQASNCRGLDGFNSHEDESPLEPRALGLRSQWYEKELPGPQKSSTWSTFAGWIRKAGEKMTGQGRSHQQLSRSKKLARQPRVKPQRRRIETWVASSSSSFDLGG